ncbi:MAG: Mur ligase family protein [Chitinophagales bacterium]|nr:Mur ligase family protein [Chitinophagales bacterium]
MSVKSYHFIAIGGAIMHQLAIHLHRMGHQVSGSDDVIYDPAKTNLSNHGLLPKIEGWNKGNIHKGLDAVILGMHAKDDNPELVEAKRLGIKIYSFPEFIYEQSKNKTRVVIAGSHGKTTTTSMIMHVLKAAKIDFDYLVGAKIEGFDYSVKTSEEASIVILEGDEYLTSPIDRRSKFLHYHPDYAVITGIAWDHINVFPTFDEYLETFRKFIRTVHKKLFFYSKDEDLIAMTKEIIGQKAFPYNALPSKVENDQTFVIHNQKSYPLHIFGEHNMANLSAAFHICTELGVNEETFFELIQSFNGAANRLELIKDDVERKITYYKDFAHAPSKVLATVDAVRKQYPKRKLVAALELHTYSSLQANFTSHYAHTLDNSDIACVFVDNEALKIKNKAPIETDWIKEQFDNQALEVFSDKNKLEAWLQKEITDNSVILLMSSGHWGGMDLKKVAS